MLNPVKIKIPEISIPEGATELPPLQASIYNSGNLTVELKGVTFRALRGGIFRLLDHASVESEGQILSSVSEKPMIKPGETLEIEVALPSELVEVAQKDKLFLRAVLGSGLKPPQAKVKIT
jgi:hypothetical protein